MTVMYVASDRPGAGKTAVCAAIATELAGRGKRVAVTKAAGEGSHQDGDPDVGIYERLLTEPAAVESLPLPDRDLTPKAIKESKSAVQKTLRRRDILLIEGAAIEPEDAAELVEAVGAHVLLIVRHGPDLDVSQLAGWRGVFNDRLLGLVINGVTRYRGRDVAAGLLPAMASEGLTSLGVIPEDRRLLGVSVSEIAKALKGRYVVCEELEDRLVENFMVGGWGMDSGELYFGLRENKAVIVRGDRPDIQMAALQTPTACMVLTQGIEPIEYVSYEAEMEEVPIIVVESGTLETMASLHDLTEDASFDHPSKLERFGQLLRDHVDLNAVYGGLGLPA